MLRFHLSEVASAESGKFILKILNLEILKV